MAAVFGPIPPNDFAQLSKLALKLAEWRSPHEGGSASEPSSSSSSTAGASASPSFASAPIATTAVEWGTGLHFSFGMQSADMGNRVEER